MKQGLLIALVAAGFLVLDCLLMSVPVWLLWNWLMPIIFGLPKLTFWQALGVSLLSSFLFKNSSGGSSK